MKVSLIAGLVVIGGSSLSAVVARDSAVPGADEPSTSRFILILRTTDVDKGGTDADIDFGLTWTTPEGDKKGEFAVLPNAPGNNHEKGDVDVHLVKMESSMPIRSIAGAQIVNEMNGDKPGWHVHSLAIMAVDSNDRVWLLSDAPIGKWLERIAPAMCALPAPMLREPRELGDRKAVRDLGSLAVWQGISQKQKDEVRQAIAERDFQTSVRKRNDPN